MIPQTLGNPPRSRSTVDDLKVGQLNPVPFPRAMFQSMWSDPKTPDFNREMRKGTRK